MLSIPKLQILITEAAAFLSPGLVYSSSGVCVCVCAKEFSGGINLGFTDPDDLPGLG